MKTLFKKLIILVTFIFMGSLQVNAKDTIIAYMHEWIPVVEKFGCSEDIKNDIIEILRQFPEKEAIGYIDVARKSDYGIVFKIYAQIDTCGWYNIFLSCDWKTPREYYVTCAYKDRGYIVNAGIKKDPLAPFANCGFFMFGDKIDGAEFSDQSLYLDYVASDGKTKSFFQYPDGTWVKESEYEGTTYPAFTVPGATNALDVVKGLINSRTFPNIQLINDECAEAYVYKGTELVNKLRSEKRKENVAKLEQYKKDKEAEAQKQKEAEKALYQELCQNYGKKYVDACQRGQLIIGTPEELFALVVFSGAMKRVNNATLSSETGRKKTYKLYGPTVYNTSSRTTFTNGFVGWATFTNGKLTSISWK